MALIKCVPGFDMIKDITGYVYGGALRYICSPQADEKGLLDYLYQGGDIDVRVKNSGHFDKILDYAKSHGYFIHYLGLDYLACDENKLIEYDTPKDDQSYIREGIYSIWVKVDNLTDIKTQTNFVRYEIVFLTDGALGYTEDYTVNQIRLYLPSFTLDFNGKYKYDIDNKLITPVYVGKFGSYDQLKQTYRMARLFKLGYRPYDRDWCKTVLNECEKEIQHHTHKIYIGSKQFPYSEFKVVDMTINIWKHEMKDIYNWVSE